ARSRSVAKSGIMPMYQNSSDTVMYVLTAKTSQSRGERKLGQMALALGIGKTNQMNQTRPTWMPGNMPAQITAKIVIASAERFTAVRHFCLNRQRIAEIRVPAWPIPIHNTKLVMSQAQSTWLFRPQTPTPVISRYRIRKVPMPASVEVRPKTGSHQRPGLFSV